MKNEIRAAIAQVASNNGWESRLLKLKPLNLVLVRGRFSVAVSFTTDGRIRKAYLREHGDPVNEASGARAVDIVASWLSERS